MRRTIANEQGETLDYIFHKATPGPRRKPKKDQRPHMLIIGHGVTGNLERPVCEALANAVALRGIAVIRISFSGNGNSQGKFSESNITKEIDDLGAAIDAAIESGYDISYAGHSMGAAVGIIRASEDDRINNIIGVAPMIHTRRFVDAEFGEVTPGKGNMWGMKGFRLSNGFIDDLKSIDTVLPRVSEIDVPMLFVHGTEDDVIPFAEARAAFDFAGDPKQLISIRNANHVFEGNALQVMAHATADWLQQQVYPGSQRVKVKLPPPTKPPSPERPPRKRAVPLSKEKRAAVQAAIKRKELEAEQQKLREKEALKEAARKQAELLGEPYPPKRKTAAKKKTTKKAAKAKSPTTKKTAPAKKVAKAKVAKKTPAKKATTPKVVAKKKAPAKKVVAKKKAPAKKVVAKKKAPAKNAPKPKVAPKKKATAANTPKPRAAAKKKVPAKKVTTKKKAAPKKTAKGKKS